MERKLSGLKNIKFMIMNKKVEYYVKETNEKIKVGDTVYVENVPITVTEKVLKLMIEVGLIIQIERKFKDLNEDKAELLEEYSEVIEYLSNRLGWKLPKIKNCLKSIYNLNKRAVLDILTMEYAFLVDEIYDNHIKEESDLYAIVHYSSGVGIHNRAKYIRDVPLFRKKVEAVNCINYFKNLITQIYNVAK